MSPTDADVLRRIYPRVLSRALGFTRSLPDAEDAVQEAVVRALSSWQRDGAPRSPEAWLLTVARNVHRDRLRKGAWESPHEDAIEALSRMSPWAQIASGDPDVARGWKDELLRLLFACCHPCLEPGESAALALSTVVGLSVGEVASAFLVERRTMEQRLTRARRRLRERGDPDGDLPERSTERMGAVLRVVHLLFNEGYWSTDEDTPIRAELCRLAVGLGHSLIEAFPDRPEVAGLLALMMLHDARRPARLSPQGAPVPLPEQDRSRWDRAAIERAEALLALVADREPLGPYRLEAAISATHNRAATAADTDWATIAHLYARLEALRRTPGVRVARAFAVARAEGAAAGLALIEEARSDPERNLSGTAGAALVSGVLLEELGRTDEARAQLLEARDRSRNGAERAQIEQRIAALTPGFDT